MSCNSTLKDNVILASKKIKKSQPKNLKKKPIGKISQANKISKQSCHHSDFNNTLMLPLSNVK